MLSAGRRVVESATQALLGAIDGKACEEQVFRTEETIDASERTIRRPITLHAMAYAGEQVPLCLGLMSLVKDAERIGDYGTALYRLSNVLGMGFSGERRHDFRCVSEEVSELLERGRQSFETRDQSAAEVVIRQCTEVRDHCAGVVETLVQEPANEPQAVAYTHTGGRFGKPREFR
jgi:phosphate uptake regulator